MKRSVNRILTTHVGSLARPADQLQLLFAKERNEDYDRSLFESSTKQAIEEIVAGKHDELPEQAFLNVGGAEDAQRKARELEA